MDIVLCPDKCLQDTHNCTAICGYKICLQFCFKDVLRWMHSNGPLMAC